MLKKITCIVLMIQLASIYSATTIIPTDNSQNNLRDAYRLVFQKAAHPWSKNAIIDDAFKIAGREYFGEVPVYWSLDADQHPGSFIIPETIQAADITTIQTTFPSMTRAFSIAFNDSIPPIWILKARATDSSRTIYTWEYVYFEQFLVNVLNFTPNRHFKFVEIPEFIGLIESNTLSPSSAKILIIPAFIEGATSESEIMDKALAQNPSLAGSLKQFLQAGGTLYTEGNAAYLLESAGILTTGSVDLKNKIDGVGENMLAEIEPVAGMLPAGYSHQLYTAQAPTLSDTLHAIARFTKVANENQKGKPAVLFYEETAVCGKGKIIINAGLPAVGAKLQPDLPQWQWVANAILLGLAEKVDVVRSIYVPTDSLHAEPMSLPVGEETTFEVTLQVLNLWNRASGVMQLTEQYNSFFDFAGMVAGPEPLINESNQTLQFDLSGLNPQVPQIITYRLKSPGLSDPRIEKIDQLIDADQNMRVSELKAKFADPQFADKERNFARNDLKVRFLFEARLVADLDLSWKNILDFYYQPFKIFTVLENKERTAAVKTEIVNYIALDVPVYTTINPLIPIERTPPGKFMDVLHLGGDIDGDKLTDGPDVGFKSESIFPNAASVETVRVNWKNPWTEGYDDFDFDGQVPTDNDSDGVVDPGYTGDKLRALKITWKPGLNTETEGTVPGYQFYDPYCYSELWIDPPNEVKMAIGAAKNDTTRFAVTDSIWRLESFYYPNWERWMEHDSLGNLQIAHLIKRHHQDFEGFALLDSSYTLKPDDIDYGWIPKPVRSSVFFLSFGGRGPSMTNPLTKDSDFSTVTYQTIWGREKEVPLRSAYTYYAPLPNPLQFEYISESCQITDPRTSKEIQELPGHRQADLTFNISISTEYSLYWINAMTPDKDGDGIGDGVYSYVIQQIPKGMGGYTIDLPRDASGRIDTLAVADPPPAAIWETPFAWQIYWKDLRIPAALDDDNDDGIDDWLDDTGDRFFNAQDSAFLPDNFPPGVNEPWLPGPDGEYGDDVVEALGTIQLKVFARFNGKGREGLLKINDGAWLVNEEIFGGPPWVQFSHVQQAWAVGHDIQITGKPDPTFVDIHATPVLAKFEIKDAGEPHDFDILFDPWLKSIGSARSNASTYLGLRDPAHQIEPDIEMPARVNRNQSRSITFLPGINSQEFPGYPKQGSGLFIQVIVEVNNIGEISPVVNAANQQIGTCTKTHWYDVSIQPNLSALGNSEVFGCYAAYPRPLVPNDDYRTLKAGWRFNPSPDEILIQPGKADGSATIPEIQATRRGYFIFLMKIDPTLANGCYQIPFNLTGMARLYSDSLGGVPLQITIPEARFSLSNGVTEQFVIGEAEFIDIRDIFKPYVKFEPAADVRWTYGTEPTDSSFLRLNSASALVSDSILTISAPMAKFPGENNRPDTDFWLVSRQIVDVPDAGEALPLDTGLRLTYRDHFGYDSTIVLPPLTVAARGVDLLITKKINRVNNTPVENNTFLLKEGQNQIDLQIEIQCLGSDLARTPELTQILGSMMELQTSTLPPHSRKLLLDGNQLVTWHLPDMIPGSRRQMNLTLNLAYVTLQEMRPILICDTTRANYLKFSAYESTPISYFLDLAIDPQAGLKAVPENPAPGESVTLSANIHREGFVVARNLMVRFFQNNPTDPQNSLGEILLERLTAQDTVITFTWEIPNDGRQLFEIYSLVDADSTIGEMAEKNNISHITLSTASTLMLENLVNYPNPFSVETEFIFTLTQSAEITIKIYALDGRLLRTLDYGTCDVGYNSHYWDGLDADGDVLPNGTFIYKVIARNVNKTVEQKEYLVKMK